MTELQVQGQEALGLIRVQNQLIYLRDMLCDQHTNASRRSGQAVFTNPRSLYREINSLYQLIWAGYWIKKYYLKHRLLNK